MTQNATILEGRKCFNCSWPIVSTLNNDDMGKITPYAHDDYWYYCSNKTCKNHEGKGFSLGYGAPDFAVSSE